MTLKGRRLKPLPAKVFSLLGPLVVTHVDNIPDDDGKPSHDLGFFNYATREIQLKSGMHHTQAWHTLIHERMHSCLFDAGIKLSDEHEEQVCDAVATLLVAELRAAVVK